MSEHGQKAKDCFLAGYNCSQAVLLAFSDITGLDTNTALRISLPFGGGMGRLREVCGAVSGMFMVLGLVAGYDSPEDKAGKKLLYERVQALAEKFKEKNSSIVCRELLGLETAKSAPTPAERCEGYYKKRPCAELVCDAAEILNDFLKENKLCK